MRQQPDTKPSPRAAMQYHMVCCDACTEAELGESGSFTNGCRGCADRALAESPAAFSAFNEPADPAALRELIVSLFEQGGRAEALVRIRAWYDLLRARRAALDGRPA